MKKIIPILRAFLVAATVACAAAFIIQTARIYYEAADQMYTTAIISEHFRQIAWAPIAMLVMIIAGAFLPYPDLTAKVSEEYRMEALLAKVDKKDEKIVTPLKRLRLVRILAIALACVCCVALLAIGTRKTLFVSMDLEASMGEAMPLLMIPVAILFVGELLLSLKSKKLSGQIFQVAKTMERLPQEPADEETKSDASNGERTRRIIRIALYTVAVVFVIVGIINGGLYDVFVKAVNICTECIGLG